MREKLWAFQSRYAPYFFVAPFVILFCAFMIYPLVRSGVLSFHQTAGELIRFVGVKNYLFLPADPMFWTAVLNSVGYAVALLVIQIPAALGLAILLDSKWVRGRNVFRLAFFVPHLVGSVFVAVIFGMMLSTNGPLNEFLRIFFPNAELNWLGSPVLARPAVVLAAFWLSVGYGMIYFLASLQSVDRGLYEAAEVDGAGRWGKFWHVTLPGIKPVLYFLILTSTIGGLQIFELPFVLFQGYGPGLAGLTIVGYLFSYVEGGDLGTAAAIGWVLAAAIIGIALVQIRVMRGAKEES